MNSPKVNRILWGVNHIMIILTLASSQFLFGSNTAFAQNPEAHFEVNLTDNYIDAFNWTLGSSVHISIDDPDNGVGIDYEDDAVVGVTTWDPNMTHAKFILDDFTIEPYQQITITGGSVSKTHTVIDLAVTNIDFSADGISGRANPGKQIQVWVNAPLGIWNTRWVTTEADGTWVADFSTPGDGSDAIDISLGMSGGAKQRDEEADATFVTWRNYTAMEINLSDNYINAYDWVWGTAIHLSINDPDNGPGIDYTDTKTVNATTPWDPDQTMVQFVFGNFELQPGQEVTITDGTLTKTHTIINITVTEVDLLNDKITGRALPNAQVSVWVNTPSGEWNTRWVVAETDGTWLADFSIPSNGGSTIDITTGMYGGAWQMDADNDFTRIGWNVPNPMIQATPPDSLEGGEWPIDREVTLTIDDPGNGLGVDYTDTQSPYHPSWNPNTTWVDFALDDFELKPNQLVVLTNGQITTTHTVMYVTVTGIDMATDIISGKADPGAEVTVQINKSGAPYRVVNADGSGNWSADFSVPWADQGIYNITMQLRGSARRYDADGNYTRANWRTPNPQVYIYMSDYMIQGVEWTLDSSVTLTIDDPDNGPGVDYTDTQTVEVAWWNPDETNVEFNIEPFELRPNQLVTLTDGVTTVSEYIPYPDIDEDGQHDLIDPCPGDPDDLCDPNGSAAGVIGTSGGTITTENGKVTLSVPSGAMDYTDSLSVTDMGGNYEIATDQGSMLVIHSYSIQPSGTQFDPPATIIFKWDDADNNGIVDGTTLREKKLVIVKDGLVVTNRCDIDPDCDMNANSFSVQVNSLSLFDLAAPSNEPPQITFITAPVAPVQLGQSINATTTFTDPDVGDTHTVKWIWGDGSTTTSSATVPSVTASHIYTSAGVYTVTATITDAAGESDTEVFQYVVIYDPNGGYVTGGGWINSPAGAYTANPSLTGKATFGFVSKYQKGANVPTGNTEFQFKVADLNFKSTSYDWLVIAGSKAQYKGTGTVNGTGEYKFMLTATDGTPDKFRIKIWNKATGEMIYDNQLGASDDALPITAIGGGSIVIHKEK